LRRVAGGLPGEVAVLAQRHAEAAQGRITGDGRAGGAPADDEGIEALVGQAGQRRGSPTGAGHLAVTAMCSSSSCRGDTTEGASVARSVPFWVLGKAITSRSDSA